MALCVGFQGEHGAFSEEAIVRKFGARARPVPFQSLREAFDSVMKLEADLAVVPVENSLEGGVTETYDLLLTSELKITGEIKVRIRHCLISKPEASLVEIATVLSHPQALAQCRNNLAKLGLKAQQFYDTAGSVKFIADSTDVSLAAIASEYSARVYGMKVLRRSMEDSKSNYTRFLILGRRAKRRSKVAYKTSLVFSTRHRPGSLFRALEPFAREGINLTKIESRPTKQTPWEYYFHIDLDGSVYDGPVSRAIKTLRTRADFVRVLGSYPADSGQSHSHGHL